MTFYREIQSGHRDRLFEPIDRDVRSGSEIDKIGNPQPIKVNVRIVAATNRDLKARIEDGQLREDLFYRLSVVAIHIPPLRERREDIPPLVDHFLRKYATRYDAPGTSISEEAMEQLSLYGWPGNVRELENVIERIVVLGKGGAVRVEDLPPEVRQTQSRIANIHLKLPDEGIDLEEIEKEMLIQALDKHGCNQTQAAKCLNISRKTLIYRMEKFSLQPTSDSATS